MNVELWNAKVLLYPNSCFHVHNPRKKLSEQLALLEEWKFMVAEFERWILRFTSRRLILKTEATLAEDLLILTVLNVERRTEASRSFYSFFGQFHGLARISYCVPPPRYYHREQRNSMRTKKHSQGDERESVFNRNLMHRLIVWQILIGEWMNLKSIPLLSWYAN